jgi:enoyl-CoA hydratase
MSEVPLRRPAAGIALLRLGGADLPLDEALRPATRNFQALFATEGRAEGTPAFLERRQPAFQGR